MARLGIDFQVFPPLIDESKFTEEDPFERAFLLANKKCQALISTGKFFDRYILCADTIVEVDGKALGQPVDKSQGQDFLRLLSGKSHQVITGLALAVPDGKNHLIVAKSDITKVFFRQLREEEINRYLESNEYLDKAGAYGIQGKGAGFIRRIEGCYYNVVGLPGGLLLELLNDNGFFEGK